MKKPIAILCSAIITASLLGACTRQDVGTVSGGVVGAAAGNVLTGGSTVGTVIGAGGGALAGHELSR